MKILVLLICTALLGAVISGCTTAPAKGPVKTLCPACGYEFQPPLSGM